MGVRKPGHILPGTYTPQEAYFAEDVYSARGIVYPLSVVKRAYSTRLSVAQGDALMHARRCLFRAGGDFLSVVKRACAFASYYRHVLPLAIIATSFR